MTRSSSALAAALLLCGAAGAAEFHEGRPCMGTRFEITVHSDRPAAEVEAAAEAAFRIAAELDACLSDYRADSEVGRFHRTPAGATFAVSDTLSAVLTKSIELAAATGGTFDPARGALTRLWRMARRTGELPKDADLAAARAASGLGQLEFDPETGTLTRKSPETRLDFGGIAKGFAADAMLAHLRDAGFPAASIAAGGDLRFGQPPPGKDGWEVQFRPAGSGGTAAMSLLLKEAAVSTSGAAEQTVTIGGTRYSHLINPKTGLGHTADRAACVIAPSATESDALATALAIGGEATLLAIQAREGCHGAIFSPSTESVPSTKTHKFPQNRLSSLK